MTDQQAEQRETHHLSEITQSLRALQMQYANVINRLDQVSAGVDTLTKILLGDGDTSKALVVRFECLERSVSKCQTVSHERYQEVAKTRRFTWTTAIALGAAITGAIALAVIIWSHAK